MTTDNDDSNRQRTRLTDSQQQAVRELAGALGESAYGPVKQIVRVVRVQGEAFAREMLAETLKVEAAGGMTVENGKRRRTPGGVFFYLVRGRLNNEQRRVIFPQFGAAQRRRIKEQYKSRPSFDWDSRHGLIAALTKKRGEITEMQVKLIGRPRRYEKKREVVVLVMAHDANHPPLPRGVPPLPAEPTLYTVYVSSGQWRKVEGMLKNNDRLLVIEGAAAYDAETQSVSVYTTGISTRKVKAKPAPDADKAAEPAAESDAEAKSSAKATSDAKAETEAAPVEAAKTAAKADATTDDAAAPDPAPTPIPPLELPPIPDDLPAETRQKLDDLQRAAQQYHERAAQIRARPADQQFGLEMTERLLTSVRRQIDALLAPADPTDKPADDKPDDSESEPAS